MSRETVVTAAQRAEDLLAEHDSRMKACTWNPGAYAEVQAWIRGLSAEDCALLWGALKLRIKADRASRGARA